MPDKEKCESESLTICESDDKLRGRFERYEQALRGFLNADDDQVKPEIKNAIRELLDE